MPQPSSSYIPQLFQPYQFPGEREVSYPQYHTQHNTHNTNGIVIETLRIVREIMQYGNNSQVPPVQFVRRVKRERSAERSNSNPAEIITLEPEPESKKSPEKDSNEEEGTKEEKKIEKNDQEEESGCAEVDPPPSRERINNMVKTVKRDDKSKSKKPNQSQRK